MGARTGPSSVAPCTWRKYVRPLSLEKKKTTVHLVLCPSSSFSSPFSSFLPPPYPRHLLPSTYSSRPPETSALPRKSPPRHLGQTHLPHPSIHRPHAGCRRRQR